MLIPPNSTRSSLTFVSSGLVGVYIGINVTSWPRASSSTASALSRAQLPQYIPAEPAVIERIFITYRREDEVPAPGRRGQAGRMGGGKLDSGLRILECRSISIRESEISTRRSICNPQSTIFIPDGLLGFAVRRHVIRHDFLIVADDEVLVGVRRVRPVRHPSLVQERRLDDRRPADFLITLGREL